MGDEEVRPDEPQRTKPHVLVLPFPIQGHINPMLQFSKRLISKGVRVTLLTTSSTHSIFLGLAATATSVDVRVGREDRFPVRSSGIHRQKQSIDRNYEMLTVEPLDDGFEEGRSPEVTDEYFRQLQDKVSQSLSDLISTLNPKPNAVVYDSGMPWALDVSRRFGVAGASFFTQSWAVNAVYYHLFQGAFKELQDDVVLPALPPLTGNELPAFAYDSRSCPPLFDLLMSQFCNLHEVDFILANSFDGLEVEVLKWMEHVRPIKNVGPTVPSMFLDKRLADDKNYGLNLFTPKVDECLKWLASRQPRSVVYVAFGSLAVWNDEQMKELATGLKQTNHYFLWVVRETESKKLPENYSEDVSEKGLIVSWSPQLEVLAHASVGCFLTHCGWNSTLEALSLGVPMIGMPNWSDQPTNAKFMEDVWKVGVRVKADGDGFVKKEEIVRCVSEVMEGENGIEMKRNAEKWKEMAIETVCEGGNSDKNIEDFVNKLIPN